MSNNKFVFFIPRGHSQLNVLNTEFSIYFSEGIALCKKFSHNLNTLQHIAFTTFILARSNQMFVFLGQVFSVFLFGVVYWARTINNK